MADERFWREKPPEWRETFETDSGPCTATGIVYVRYPIYCCPGLSPDVPRSLRQRLFSRPWKPLAKIQHVVLPQWIIESVKFGKVKIGVLLAAPEEVEKLEQSGLIPQG